MFVLPSGIVCVVFDVGLNLSDCGGSAEHSGSTSRR
jgi:hypothetical protein